MDSITQAALGGAIGEAMLGKKVGNKGAVIGAIAATIPDLDVVLYLFIDPLNMLSIHRGFSHSIVFSVLAAVLTFLILRKMKWFHGVSSPLLFLFSFLCLFTHILLDTFTAYGTQLLLPFSNIRLGLDSINVVDPVYTVPLIIGLLLSLWIFRHKPNRSQFNKWGMIISTTYLMFTLVNKERVTTYFTDAFSNEEIEYSSLLTMPVGIANLNWYGVAKTEDSLYMKQYHTLGDGDFSTVSFPIHDEYLETIDNSLAEQMRWFAKGFYTVEKIDNGVRVYNLQVDMRGIVDLGGKKAPTVGYFEITEVDGVARFSSGSLE
ncbi:MAG: metal-dependent hydrolase [Chitinophagales bacterium]|nr:metal-dependent hydrolase [Chitinophagales bacterium]